MEWRKKAGKDKRHYDVCVCHGTCELLYILVLHVIHKFAFRNNYLRHFTTLFLGPMLNARNRKCWIYTKWYLSLSHGRALVSIKIRHVRGFDMALCLIAAREKVEVENMQTVAGEIRAWREQRGWVRVTSANNCRECWLSWDMTEPATVARICVNWLQSLTSKSKQYNNNQFPDE